MRKDEIPELKDSEKNKEFVPKNFQHFRDRILVGLRFLTFKEKFNLIKEADKRSLAKFNTYSGTRAVHTLDYVHKFPSRKKELTLVDHIHLYWREIEIFMSLKDFHKERRRSRIRVIK
jgi:hypothetical protein